MMTDKELIAKLLEFLDEPSGITDRQEYLEQMTDERLRIGTPAGMGDGTSEMQLQKMLNDEQMHELVEQIAFAKRAFKNEEFLTVELAIADEWEKFAAAHAEELDALDEDKTASKREQMQTSLSSRLAASFIGAVMASGIALAAIHLWNLTPTLSPKDEGHSYTQASGTIRQSPSLPWEESREATIIFDNVPLDTMLMEMADYYHVSVKFEHEESRQLRFHFVWKRTDDLNRIVEKLNNFEAVNIIREPEKLIVK